MSDMKISSREHDLTKRELELAKTEISILKQQHEISIQLPKKEYSTVPFIVERGKIVNDWMDAELKPVMDYLSHNMKTWEDAEAQQKKDNVGKDKKDQTEIKLRALWKFTNLNKQIILNSDVSHFRLPLLTSFYKTDKFLPIFEHFFKSDYESGKIPKLTHHLKLYFSTPHVMDGKWVQFHGPGSFFDKNGWLSGTMWTGEDNDVVLSGLSLCDFNKKKRTWSRTDEDRCYLKSEECKKRHKETDTNYASYHSPATKPYTNDFVINIKWD
jgi:hypothetical protein